MKINTKELKEKLSIIRTAIGKSHIPALECALIKNGRIYGSNTIMYISSAISADGEMLIPAKAMDLIKSIKSDDVDIEIKNDKLVIKQGRSTSRFATIDVAEYPEIPIAKSTDEVVLSAETMRSISSVSYACATMDTRPMQQGVLVSDEIVASDGYRIAIDKTSNNINSVIPAYALRTLNMLSGDITMVDDNTRIFFRSGETEISIVKMYGDFLNYKQAIPKGGNSVKIDRTRMIEILEMFSVAVDDKVKTPIIIEISNGVMKLSVCGTTCECEDEIDIGADFEIKIGARVNYLYDAVKSMEKDFEMRFTSAVSPIALETDCQLAVVLPVRLRDV